MPAKTDVASSMQRKPGEGAGEDGGGTSNDAVVKMRSSPHHRKVDDTTEKVVDSNPSSEIAGPRSCYTDTEESLLVSVSAADGVQNPSSSSPCQQNPAPPAAATSNGKPVSIRAGRRQGCPPCQSQVASPRQTAPERSSHARPFAEKVRFCAQPYGPASFPGSVETYGERNAWQFQPMWAATVSPSHHHHHHQLYHQNPPRHAYYESLHANRRTQGMLGNHESVIHPGSYPFTGNPNCLSPVTYKSQEFYYPCSIQQPHSPSTTAVKGLEANNQEEKQSNDNYHIQNCKVTTDDGNRSKDGTTVQSHTARSPGNVDTNIPPKNPALSHLKKPRSKDGEWHRHGNRCSSDSGWISDNSCSSKEDELMSPTTLISLGGTLQDVLRLEKKRPAKSSSSLDNCQEEQEDSHASSSTSSQYLSTSEENEPHGTTPPVKRNGAQQVRSMKPIPLRFANLLRAAAECAAERKMRLEGCPLVSHQNYRIVNDGYTRGVQEIRHVELGLLARAGFLQPPDSPSWYVPQFHQIPEDCAQNQYRGGNPYPCGDFYFVQSSNIFVQPNLGSPVQNTISNQSSSDYSDAAQYNDVSPDAHLGSDQQQHGIIDYYGSTPVVPLYVIPIDSVEPVNDSCAIYNPPTVVY